MEKTSRHQPLLACIVSILAIANIASRKLQDLDGPLGSTFRKIAKLVEFVSPLIRVLQYQFLVILLFFDYLFLVIEKIIQKFCPSASHVFDKIEELVVMIVSLPEKFNDTTADKFPPIIYQFSLEIRQWALVHLVSWLNCLISTLNQMEQENSRMKEIMIDNHDNVQLETKSDSLYATNDECFCPSQCLPAENYYKEVEKILEHIDGEGACEGEVEDTDREKEGESIVKFKDNGRSVMQEEDPILKLFESTWLSLD